MPPYYARVLVTGAREWTDRGAIVRALMELQPVLVIHGAARGADALADRVAEALGIARCAWPANWTRHGKAAGPMRNRLMFDTMQPDVVLAFPLPESRGTWHMVDYAREQGCAVLVWGVDLGVGPAGP